MMSLLKKFFKLNNYYFYFLFLFLFFIFILFLIFFGNFFNKKSYGRGNNWGGALGALEAES